MCIINSINITAIERYHNIIVCLDEQVFQATSANQNAMLRKFLILCHINSSYKEANSVLPQFPS